MTFLYDADAERGAEWASRARGSMRAHKELIFRAPDHRYDRAVPGSYRLVPTADMRTKLAADYERMSVKIFDTPPAFTDVMASIEALEHHLNAAPAGAPDAGGIRRRPNRPEGSN